MFSDKITLCCTVGLSRIGAQNKNRDKRLHIIKNIDNDHYFMFKHMGKVYAFISLYLLMFQCFLFSNI